MPFDYTLTSVREVGGEARRCRFSKGVDTHNATILGRSNVLDLESDVMSEGFPSIAGGWWRVTTLSGHLIDHLAVTRAGVSITILQLTSDPVLGRERRS